MLVVGVEAFVVCVATRHQSISNVHKLTVTSDPSRVAKFAANS